MGEIDILEQEKENNSDHLGLMQFQGDSAFFVAEGF